MRLATRFTVAVVLTLTLVFVAQGAIRWQREATLFRTDIARDHRALGRGLAIAAADLWAEEGPGRAAAMVAAVDARKVEVHIRLVALDPATVKSPAPLPSALPDALPALTRGEVASWVEEGPEAWIFTVVPLVEGAPPGVALELSESLTPEQRYRRTSLGIVALTTVLASALVGLVIARLGRFFIGEPVARLVDQTRRVGRGDLNERLAVRGGDELAGLAAEMNRMVDHLVEARERLAEEAAGRRVAQEQLRHANRLISVGRLASGVIHELGTPLTVISARARMIGSGELDGDEVSDNARIIDEATGRITGILRRMLDFSRAGRQPPAPVDLAALAGEAAVLLAPLARKHQAVLRVEPGERPITALGDPNELLQAITNLVLNAMQAMPQGGGVTLTPGRRTGPGGEAQVTLSVSDEGQGIAATDLPRLFTPFFTTKTTGQGTGLGLSVSHDILLAHGGTIEVESTSGEGSRFTLVLPAHTPAEAPCADAS